MDEKQKDWVGGKNGVFTTLGASNHSVTGEREENDYYATDPRAIDYLLDEGGFVLDRKVWEPACGSGHLSQRLEDRGYQVLSTDLVYRGYGIGNIDFLTCTDPWGGDILTNPPYKFAKEFVEKGLSLINDGSRVIMFLKLTFLEGKARKGMFKEYPLKTLYVSSSRIQCAKNGDFAVFEKTSSAAAYGWFVFEKGYIGKPIIEWIN